MEGEAGDVRNALETGEDALSSPASSTFSERGRERDKDDCADSIWRANYQLLGAEEKRPLFSYEQSL